MRTLLTIIFYLFAICILGCFACEGKTVYVSSSQGDDTNSGLTQKDPLKSIAKALTIADSVLLKSGDLFYEKIIIHRGLLSKYGGEKLPVVCGYKRIIEPRWEKVGENLWKISLSDGNYSGYTIPSSMENNIGCLHEYDKNLIHGRKVQFKKELKEDWDIWQTENHTPGYVEASDFDSLYLYYRDNPNYLQLEFSVGSAAVVMSNASISKIHFEGFGFGISAGNRSTISNCEIDAMGGMTIISNDYVCYGNGIEFWIEKGMTDCLAENNIISRCYDSGCTLQGREYSPNNIIFRGNIIIDCCQGWEDFLSNDDENVVFKDCVFEKNIVINSGNTTGFGYPISRNKYCHVLGNNYKGNKGMIFRRNIFIGGNFLCAAEYNGGYKSNIWQNNLCYIRRGEWLLECINRGRAFIELPNTKEEYTSLAEATDVALKRYRELTGDMTTIFIVKSDRAINRRIKKLKRKYLNK